MLLVVGRGLQEGLWMVVLEYFLRGSFLGSGVRSVLCYITL